MDLPPPPPRYLLLYTSPATPRWTNPSSPGQQEYRSIRTAIWLHPAPRDAPEHASRNVPAQTVYHSPAPGTFQSAPLRQLQSSPPQPLAQLERRRVIESPCPASARTSAIDPGRSSTSRRPPTSGRGAKLAGSERYHPSSGSCFTTLAGWLSDSLRLGSRQVFVFHFPSVIQRVIRGMPDQIPERPFRDLAGPLAL